MKERITYLDSSAILKRYVKEAGSDIIRHLYRRAYAGEVKISFNIWNIGEVLGVLERARTIGRLDNESYITARKRFLLEVKRMIKLNILTIIPFRGKILLDTWGILEKHHINQADALQLASAKHIDCIRFFTGNKKLHDIALKEGLNSTYLG